MQNVDRMFAHLAQTIRARFPNLLTQPFTIGEVAQTILPYRHNRRDLGVDTNDDYELTLVQLLVSDYVIVDDEVREAMREELKAPNPDPTAWRRFAGSRMALSPNALRAAEPAAGAVQPPSAAPRGSPVASAAAPAASSRGQTPAAQPSAMATRPSGGQTNRTPSSGTRGDGAHVTPRGIVAEKGDVCKFCDGALPPGRAITFCPHCGQNLTMTSCPACGSELELGWRFCPTCGRQAAGA